MSVPVRFDNVVAVYDTFIGRWTRVFMPAVVRAAGVERGQRVLDLATGTGESALMLADVVAPSGSVIGADLSMPMLRAAAAKTDGRAIRLAAMDGQSLACRPASFDAVVCELGLMFFPDPVAGAAEARRVLREGGRFGALVWASVDRVPWFGPLAAELLERFPERASEILPGMSLGDPARFEDVLKRAGLRGVTVTPETQSIVLESFAEYWTHVESGAVRIGVLLRDLPPEERSAIRGRVGRAMARFDSGGRLALPTTALVGVGRA